MREIINKLRYVKLKDFYSIFLFLFALIPSFFLRLSKKNIWLISEDGIEARDNGYHLFKYIREKHSEDEVYFAIDKHSVDHKRIEGYGNVLQSKGLIHWVYYLAATVNISSQKGGGPNAAVCYVLEVIGLRPSDRIYLKHGITYRNCEYIHYEKTKFKMIVCGAYPEYQYIRDNFGYPAEAVKYLGLCRFDALNNIDIDRKKILLMPTWRKWIAQPTSKSYEYDDVSDFKKTEYFRRYNDLINNKELHVFLHNRDLTLYFYQHRNMQKFTKHFNSPCDRIVMVNWEEVDIQEILKETAMMITDYSSAFFDFAYMKKPIVFFQFDLDKYRKAHYADGYFSYEKDGFGPVCHDSIGVLNEVKKLSDKEFRIDETYEKRINNFFTQRDSNNCKRTYDSIYKLIKK